MQRIKYMQAKYIPNQQKLEIYYELEKASALGQFYKNCLFVTKILRGLYNR
jgi:hypothetical protein